MKIILFFFVGFYYFIILDSEEEMVGGNYVSKTILYEEDRKYRSALVVNYTTNNVAAVSLEVFDKVANEYDSFFDDFDNMINNARFIENIY